jgi:hypothetical protein
MKIIELEIYNEDVGKVVKRSENGFFCLLTLFNMFRESIPLAKGIETQKQIPYFIQKGIINDNWLVLDDWSLNTYRKNQDGFLFRSVRPRDYATLIEHGTDRATMKGFDEPSFEEAGILSRDIIWVDRGVHKPWEYAYKNNPSIIVVYKGKFFKRTNLGNYGVYAYVRKDARVDFKDTVEVIIKIEYKY